MWTNIRNVKFSKVRILKCLSPLFVLYFYSRCIRGKYNFFGSQPLWKIAYLDFLELLYNNYLAGPSVFGMMTLKLQAKNICRKEKKGMEIFKSYDTFFMK